MNTTEKPLLDKRLRTIENYLKNTDKNTQFYDACIIAQDALISAKENEKLIAENDKLVEQNKELLAHLKAVTYEYEVALNLLSEAGGFEFIPNQNNLITNSKAAIEKASQSYTS